MLSSKVLIVVDDRGFLFDEVKMIFDQIVVYDVVLLVGYLHISEIWLLFVEAKVRGVIWLLVNYFSFLIDVNHVDMKKLVVMGAYLEHSCCMWVGVQGKNYIKEGLKVLMMWVGWLVIS